MNCMRGDTVRVTVCELPDTANFEDTWHGLLKMVWTDGPDILVLPELPFSDWFCAGADFDSAKWAEAVRSHTEFVARIGEAKTAVIYSTPTDGTEGRRNHARITSPQFDFKTHAKRHLPNEAGYWEAQWYDPGEEDPCLVDFGSMKVGVRLCTEMWNFGAARRLGAEGADLIAIPRTTPLSSRERWICGGRGVAITAGAYCVSSNRSGSSANGVFGGAGWIIDPDGELVAVTTENCPIITCEIGLQAARRAKATYPRYVIPVS
jgi:predicted amidohydrolase